jgi:hypothetical protein
LKKLLSAAQYPCNAQPLLLYGTSPLLKALLILARWSLGGMAISQTPLKRTF